MSEDNNNVYRNEGSESVSGQYYQAPVYVPTGKKQNRQREGSLLGRIFKGIYKLFFFSAIVFGVIVLLGTIMYFSGSMVASQLIQDGDKLNRIAVIDLEGTIGVENSSGFARLLKVARQDETVKGVIISVNSPGGEVVPSDLIAHEIDLFRKQSGKPVYVSVQQMSASGAYWATAACDRIYAQTNSMVGSIGVIYTSFVVKDTLDKIGISPVVVKSSRSQMKDKGSPFRVPTADEIVDIQKDIDTVHDRFIDIVAAARKLDREKVVAHATGDVFDGPEAVNAGLIDELGYMEDVIAALQARLNIDKPQVFRISATPSFHEMLMKSDFMGNKFDLKAQYLQMATASKIQAIWMGN